MESVSFVMLPMLILLLLAAIAVLVLLVWLCIKKPWVGAIIALVFLVMLASFFVLRLNLIPHRRIVRYEPEPVQVVPSVIHSGDTTAAIWSPGIEDQFEADIYPSKLSAVRSLGSRMTKPVRKVFGDHKSPKQIIVLKKNIDHQLVQEFGDTVAKVFPETSWFARNEWSEIKPDKVWMKLKFVDIKSCPIQWQNSDGKTTTSGRIEATAIVKDKQSTINARFVEKPWVDNLTEFLNSNPNSRYLIARSSESCMSEAEANRQAMENACFQVGPLLTNLQDPITLSSSDILENGLIIDRFVQSFYGSAGKIWRQALLIDTSPEKLHQLIHRNATIAKARKFGFIKTISSIAGLFILIIIVYAFLNVATKGYYTWSLRVAGLVLAVILIFLLFA